MKSRRRSFPDKHFQRIETLFDGAQLPTGILAEKVLLGYRRCYRAGQERMRAKVRALMRGTKMWLRIKRLGTEQ